MTLGMFDRLIDAQGREWQTKAFGRNLDVFTVGEPIEFVARPPIIPTVSIHQVEVLGGDEPPYRYSFATIRDGVLESVDVPRDEHLPLLHYTGYWTAAMEGGSHE